MKVFLSWSGEVSRQVAQILREWLPNVIQALEPWMSSEDIEKGARWGAEVASQLSSIRAGIICVTSDNREAPWLNFEAGALSKIVDSTMVCPFLFHIKPAELKGPLVQFQASEATKEDVWKILTTLNKAVEPKPLSETSLRNAFSRWWPDLELKLESVESIHPVKAVKRSAEDMLEELVDSIREQGKAINQINFRLVFQSFQQDSRMQGTSGLPRSTVPFSSTFGDNRKGLSPLEMLVQMSHNPAETTLLTREPSTEFTDHDIALIEQVTNDLDSKVESD